MFSSILLTHGQPRSILSGSPLHDAKEPQVIESLLKNGANPNLCKEYRSEKYTLYPMNIDGYLNPPSSWLRSRKDLFQNNFYDSLTPIEAACVNGDYKKARVLASFSPCTMNTNTITNTIIFLVLRSDKGQNYEDYKEGYDLLEQLTAMLPPNELHALREKPNFLTHSSLKANEKSLALILEIFNNCKQRNDLIETLIPAWIVILQECFYDTKSYLYMFPIDLLSKILFITCDSDPKTNVYFYESFYETRPKIDVFKKIYTILSEQSFFSSVSHTFLKDNENVKSGELIFKIEQKIALEPNCLTAAVWKIAQKYFDSFNADNHQLVGELVGYCMKNCNTFTLSSSDDDNKYFKKIIIERMDNLNLSLLGSKVNSAPRLLKSPR
jgi:hypothetical protein